MSEKIVGFTGEYAFLANAFFSPIVVRQNLDRLSIYRKLAFATLEHAYQAEKLANFEHVEAVRLTENPHAARLLARQFTKRANWNVTSKLTAMTKLMDVKFNLLVELYRQTGHIPALTAKLLATQDALLINNNNYGDTFWGQCYGEGLNHLGLIIMRQRSKIRGLLERHEPE